MPLHHTGPPSASGDGHGRPSPVEPGERAGRWTVVRRRSDAAAHHAAAAAAVSVPLAGPVVVVREVDAAAWVLGSTQQVEVLRPAVRAAAADGTGPVVVRRRSGGGLVPLAPGGQLWVDLVVPAGDPLWDGDPVRAAVVAGEWWAAALRRAGAGPVRGPASGPGAPTDEDRALGRVVCFAGMGPGEVEVADDTGAWRKTVGISQRRTRHGAALQCVVPRVLDGAAVVDALDPDVVGAEVVSALARSVGEGATPGVGVLADALLPALLAELASA